MNEAELREAICEAGRRLWQLGYTPANAGNLSVRLDAERLLCTPTGVSKGFMQPADLVVLDYDGQPLGPGQASSEVLMHLAFYRQRPEVGAVVHVHPPVATGYAASGLPFPDNVLTEAVCLLGRVPTAAFATPGTPEVPAVLEPYLEHGVAYLLANHGAITLGADLWATYHLMEVLEHAAQVSLVTAQLRSLAPIPPETVRELAPEF